MARLILYNKLKHFVIFVINLMKRALCCFRKRRRNSFDDENVTLTHVISTNSSNQDEEKWEDWNVVNDKPKTVQDHINLYRKQTYEASVKQQSDDEQLPQLDFFEDMTPKITRQTKVLISTENDKVDPQNRLNFVPDTAITDIEVGELREWEENSGWEGQTLDWDVQEALRLKKKQERERKMWEQQQKRQEKLNKSLGARIST